MILALRVMHVDSVPHDWALGIRIAQWSIFAILLGLIFCRRRALRNNRPLHFASIAALVAWMMLFSPICWNHYIVYLFPFWGWLAWEMTRGWAARR